MKYLPILISISGGLQIPTIEMPEFRPITLRWDYQTGTCWGFDGMFFKTKLKQGECK